MISNLLLRAAIAGVMAALIAIPPAAPASAATTSAQVRYSIFGLEGCSLRCTSTVDSMQFSTGTVKQLATLGEFCPTADLASDLQHAVMYAAIVSGGGICGSPADHIDVLTSSGVTSHPVAQAPTAMVYDPNTKSLFGVAGASVVKISTADWSEKSVALPSQVGLPALSTQTHMLFVATTNFSTSPISGNVYSVDTETLAVSTGPTLSDAIETVTYDPASNELVGVSDNTDAVLRVDPLTGAEVQIASPSWALSFPKAAVIEPTNHEVIFLEWGPTVSGTESALVAVNDASGATAESATFTTQINSIALIARLG